MTSVKPPLLFCGAAILVGISIFLIWGSWAPLDSAAIASGQVTLTGKRKTIQHLEGGVVEAIWVKEGEPVQEGDRLISLSPTAVASQLHRILWQLKAAKVLEKRLLAQESMTQESMTQDTTPGAIVLASQALTSLDLGDLPLEVAGDEGDADGSLAQLIKTQRQIFEAKCKEQQAFLSGQQETLKAYQAQLNSLEKVLEGEREKLEGFQELHTKNIIPRFGHTMAGLFEAQRSVLEMESDRTRLKSAIAESKLKMLQFTENLKSQIASDYRENHLHLLELEQEYNRLKDIVDRMVIKSPVTGTVTGLEVTTIGGVVHPGAKLLDIVPESDELIIEASVNPQDIESVYPGLEAKIQLNAYKARLIPRISGEVLSVSADVMAPSASQGAPNAPSSPGGGAYYLVRIKVSEEALKRLSLPVTLTPGMPVTVFIVKGNRTFLQYLLSPIKDSFHKAFKEP
jgi:HlyD family type I secretion membrane fusion protein